MNAVLKFEKANLWSLFEGPDACDHVHSAVLTELAAMSEAELVELVLNEVPSLLKAAA